MFSFVKKPWFAPLAVVLLLIAMAAEMWTSVHRESLTWDEDDHLFAGYMSLRLHDFGLNPEHPPLVKMVAALPLLPLHLKEAPVTGLPFKTQAYFGGRDMLSGNGPRYSITDLTFRARVAASMFALALALLAFFAARDMFSTGAGLIAMTLVVFDPNILAHGARVTTDTGVSCMCLLTVWTTYRWARRPTLGRLLLAGLSVGLALITKHSGLVVALGLVPLLLAEWIRHAIAERSQKSGGVAERNDPLLRNEALRFVGGLVVITAIAVFTMWACYGFRYAMRPAPLTLTPTLAEYVVGLKPVEAKGILLFAHYHLLPESWLYGLTDVRKVANVMPTYFFGKVYARGIWYYFPTLLFIKLTLGSIVLVFISLFAAARGWMRRPREVLFLLVPVVFFLYNAMAAGLNIGMRHILPIVPLLFVFLAGACVALSRRSRGWTIALTLLVLAHVATSLRAYPVYMAYSNEAWGGPANTWRYLSDSNSDWAQGLIAAEKYARSHNINTPHDCYFAYFAYPFVRPEDYGIRCTELPTIDTASVGIMEAPRTFSGTLLISSADVNGFESGTKVRNPYQSLMGREPEDLIDDGIFVYHGTFAFPDAVAYAPTQRSADALKANDTATAIREARAALSISPDNFDAQFQLAKSLAAEGDRAGAEAAFARTLSLTNNMEPSAQDAWRPQIVEERDRQVIHHAP